MVLNIIFNNLYKTTTSEEIHFKFLGNVCFKLNNQILYTFLNLFLKSYSFYFLFTYRCIF